MQDRARRWRAVVLVVLMSTPVSRVTQAESSVRDSVAAESLFESGRMLVDAGRYAEACPKFAGSQKLDPSPATLLNLASCLERLGHTATAWATYREAASLASARGRADYVATADRHADALTPRLAHIVVRVPHAVVGLILERDGAMVERAEWGSSIPIDAGAHTFAATAPGYHPWAANVDVAQDGSEVTVTIPVLESVARSEARSGSAGPFPESVAAATAGVAGPNGAGQTSRGAAQRLVGLLVAGLGIVGLGVASGFAVVAKNKYTESLRDCVGPNVCGGDGLSLRSDARTDGDIASWTFALGAVALAGGVSLWLVTPRPEARSPAGRTSIALAPALGGAVLGGTW